MIYNDGVLAAVTYRMLQLIQDEDGEIIEAVPAGSVILDNSCIRLTFEANTCYVLHMQYSICSSVFGEIYMLGPVGTSLTLTLLVQILQ